MAETRTQPTGASVEGYLASRASEQQRVDCQELMTLLERVTQQKPRMWGPSIVGYGSYKYAYDSGRTGEAPLAVRHPRSRTGGLLGRRVREAAVLVEQGGQAQDGQSLSVFQAACRPRQVSARKACRRFDLGGEAAPPRNRFHLILRAKRSLKVFSRRRPLPHPLV